MSFSFDASNPQTEVTTPSGHIVTLQMPYSPADSRGILIIIAAAGISLLAVLGLLVILAFSAYKTMRAPNDHRYMRTHVLAYFVSLLLCDAISTVGSLMNGKWVNLGGVRLGTFCTSQSAFKNAGNVGTALWTLVIAIHTFCLLVLKWRSRDYILYATLFVVWAFIGLVVIIGPAAVQNVADRGPYFGVTGYWCWITDGYGLQRITLEYLWMFLSAFLSFVLYSMTFLCLRGNFTVRDGKMRLRFQRSTSNWQAWTGRNTVDGQATSVAKHMLAYPVAYPALVLPIAVCRFMDWAGHDVPFEATIFADTVFLLAGLVNVILFTTTRKIIPTRTASPVFSRPGSPGFDFEAQKASATTFATPFVVSEKEFMSAVESDQMAVGTVSVPVPMMQDLRQGRMRIPQRGVSHAPTVASVYSQKSIHDNDVPPMPPPKLTKSKSKFMKASNRQSAITPLRIVKKASLRRPNGPPATMITATSDTRAEDAGYRASLNDEASSRYSASSYNSTSSLQPLRPPPPIHAVAPSHIYKSKPSSSMESHRAPGTRF